MSQVFHESVWRAIPYTEKSIGDKLSSTTTFSSVLPLTPSVSRRAATAASYINAARARSTSSSSSAAARNERNERAAREALQWPPGSRSHSKSRGGGGSGGEASDADRELYKAVFSTMKQRDLSADKKNNPSSSYSYITEPQPSSLHDHNHHNHNQNLKSSSVAKNKVESGNPSSSSFTNPRMRVPYGAETARARAIEEAISSSTPLPYQRQRAYVEAAVAKLGSPPSKSGNRVLRPPTTIEIRPPSAEKPSSSSSTSGYVLPEFPPNHSVRTVSEISTQTHPDDATAILKISGSPPPSKTQHHQQSSSFEDDHLCHRPPFDLHLSGGSSKRKTSCMHEVGKKQSDERTLAGMHRTGGGYTGVVRAKGVASQRRGEGAHNPSSDTSSTATRGRATVSYSMPVLVHPRYLPSPLAPPLAPPLPPTAAPTPPPPPPPPPLLVVETHQKKEEAVEVVDNDAISLPQLVVFMRAFGEELAAKMGEAAAAAVEMSAAEQAAIGKAAAEAMESDELLLSLLMQEREEEEEKEESLARNAVKRITPATGRGGEEDEGKSCENKYIIGTLQHKGKQHPPHVTVRPLPSVIQATSKQQHQQQQHQQQEQLNRSKMMRPIVAPLGPSPRQQKETYQATLLSFEQDMKKADKIARDISRRASEVSQEAVLLALMSSTTAVGGASNGLATSLSSSSLSVLDHVMSR